MYLPRFNIGINKVLQQSADTTSYFGDNINDLPTSTYVSIRFEDLCSHPEVSLNKVFDCLPSEPIIPIDYPSMINKRPTTLMPTVAHNQQRIAQHLASYLTLGAADLRDDLISEIRIYRVISRSIHSLNQQRLTLQNYPSTIIQGGIPATLDDSAPHSNIS